jgi:hypothetical protein
MQGFKSTLINLDAQQGGRPLLSGYFAKTKCLDSIRFHYSINQRQRRRVLRRLQSADYADFRRKKSAPSAKSAYVLINKKEDGGVLRRLHHVLKLPVSRDWRFELGRNCWHNGQQ